MLSSLFFRSNINHYFYGLTHSQETTVNVPPRTLSLGRRRGPVRSFPSSLRKALVCPVEDLHSRQGEMEGEKGKIGRLQEGNLFEQEVPPNSCPSGYYLLPPVQSLARTCATEVSLARPICERNRKRPRSPIYPKIEETTTKEKTTVLKRVNKHKKDHLYSLSKVEYTVVNT